MLKIYPGKILLFGEYSLLFGSKGLVLPYESYQGHWDFQQLQSIVPDQDLEKFYHFSSKKISTIQFNWSLFKQDIDKGLVFSSTIPKGEGLGSSGALIAAFYDRYALNNTKVEVHGIDLNSVRADLAQLESFHHQKSSGIDPLVSWLQRPILLKGLDDLVVLNQLDGQAQWISNNDFSIYLLPTFQSRKTAEWVEKFRIKLELASFKKWLENTYCKLVDQCVDSFLTMNDQFFNYIATLCHEQEKQMAEFLDIELIHQFRIDFKDHLLGLKLCGAGGGGYFLVFSKNTSNNSDNSDAIKNLIGQYKLIKVL
jgi:mevalonate kinase